MGLTTEQFSAVIVGLRRTESGLHRPNRRHIERVSQLGWAEILLSAEVMPDSTSQTPPTVTIHDISADGVGFTFDHSLLSGSRFKLKLKRPGTGALPVIYRVAKARAISADLYSIGALRVDVVSE